MYNISHSDNLEYLFDDDWMPLPTKRKCFPGDINSSQSAEFNNKIR